MIVQWGQIGTTMSPTSPARAKSRKPAPAARSRITARVARHVQERLEAAAQWRGVPVNSFVIEAALREADNIIERERLIRLAEADAKFIIRLMEKPPAPTPAYRKAAKLHRKLFRAQD
jgi:uncharacterized protein (DUF1778 family)